MIRAERVLEVIDFLEPGEMWTTMARADTRITVFGVENDTFRINMKYLNMTLRKRFSVGLLEQQISKRSAMAFELVRMANQLGVYRNVQDGGSNE